MGTAATTLFSLAKVKDYVKAGASQVHDQQLIQIADAVSQRIEAFTRRPWVTRTVTEMRDGDGKQHFQLRHFPVQSITSARYRFSLLDGWTNLNPATDLELDDFRGYVYLKSLVWCWPKGPRTVEITYVAGFGNQDAPELPQDVYHAGLDFVKFVYDRWKTDAVALGSLSVSGSTAVVVPDLPKDLKDVLAMHTKVRL